PAPQIGDDYVGEKRPERGQQQVAAARDEGAVAVAPVGRIEIQRADLGGAGVVVDKVQHLVGDGAVQLGRVVDQRGYLVRIERSLAADTGVYGRGADDGVGGDILEHHEVRAGVVRGAGTE